MVEELVGRMEEVARSFAWVEDEKFVHHHARLRLAISAAADTIRSKMMSLEEDVVVAQMRGEI